MENRQNPGTHSLDEISPDGTHDEAIRGSHSEIHEGEGDDAHDEDEETQNEECEECGGEGVVATDEFDPDSGQYQRGVGSQKCICQIET